MRVACRDCGRHPLKDRIRRCAGAAARPEHSSSAVTRDRTGVRTRDVAPLVRGQPPGHRRGALRPKIRRARPQRTPPGPGRRWNATAATPPSRRERSPTGPHSARQPQVHLFSGRLSESCVLHDSQGRARPRCCLISVTACWSSTIESSSFLHFTASRKHFIAISSSAPLTLLRRVSTMSWL